MYYYCSESRTTSFTLFLYMMYILKAVVHYIYRQISWSELTSDPLGGVIAQTLELLHHDEEERPAKQNYRDIVKRRVSLLSLLTNVLSLVTIATFSFCVSS